MGELEPQGADKKDRAVDPDRMRRLRDEALRANDAIVPIEGEVVSRPDEARPVEPDQGGNADGEFAHEAGGPDGVLTDIGKILGEGTTFFDRDGNQILKPGQPASTDAARVALDRAYGSTRAIEGPAGAALRTAAQVAGRGVVRGAKATGRGVARGAKRAGTKAYDKTVGPRVEAYRHERQVRQDRADEIAARAIPSREEIRPRVDAINAAAREANRAAYDQALREARVDAQRLHANQAAAEYARRAHEEPPLTLAEATAYLPPVGDHVPEGAHGGHAGGDHGDGGGGYGGGGGHGGEHGGHGHDEPGGEGMTVSTVEKQVRRIHDEVSSALHERGLTTINVGGTLDPHKQMELLERLFDDFDIEESKDRRVKALKRLGDKPRRGDMERGILSVPGGFITEPVKRLYERFRRLRANNQQDIITDQLYVSGTNPDIGVMIRRLVKPDEQDTYGGKMLGVPVSVQIVVAPGGVRKHKKGIVRWMRGPDYRNARSPKPHVVSDHDGRAAAGHARHEYDHAMADVNKHARQLADLIPPEPRGQGVETPPGQFSVASHAAISRPETTTARLHPVPEFHGAHLSARAEADVHGLRAEAHSMGAPGVAAGHGLEGPGAPVSAPRASREAMPPRPMPEAAAVTPAPSAAEWGPPSVAGPAERPPGAERRPAGSERRPELTPGWRRVAPPRLAIPVVGPDQVEGNPGEHTNRTGRLTGESDAGPADTARPSTDPEVRAPMTFAEIQVHDAISSLIKEAYDPDMFRTDQQRAEVIQNLRSRSATFSEETVALSAKEAAILGLPAGRQLTLRFILDAAERRLGGSGDR